MKTLLSLLTFLLGAIVLASCEKCKDEDPGTTESCGTIADSVVIDIDGNIYHVVSIGRQCWLKENLRTSKYRNSDSIATGLNSLQWTTVNTGAWTYYGNDTSNGVPFGKLYNYYAVADPRGLCPAGWHVPGKSEWAALEIHLGQNGGAGGALKDTGTVQAGSGLWFSPNTGATNSSLFTGLAGGTRLGYDTTSALPYKYKGLTGFWWSSSSVDDDESIGFFLGHSTTFLGESQYGKANGFSIRCVRD